MGMRNRQKNIDIHPPENCYLAELVHSEVEQKPWQLLVAWKKKTSKLKTLKTLENLGVTGKRTFESPGAVYIRWTVLSIPVRWEGSSLSKDSE